MRNKRQTYLEEQLMKYEQTTKMTGKERRALRNWVKSGHSVYESPGSRYLCDRAMPVQDFLDVYRQDEMLEKEMAGMTRGEQEVWLKEYMGYEEPVRESDADATTLDERIRKLERKIFHLWEFIGQEGLWSEATEYMEENENDPMPFEI